MSIFISTGGFKTKTALESVELLSKNNISDIELSGGKYSENYLKDILKFKENCKFQVHNYFPPPKEPFVINLASLNKEIEDKSLRQVEQSIIFASKIGASHYSVHAGFLLDPQPKELGSSIKKVQIFDKEKSKEKFFKNINKISEISKKYKINLLVENNVVSHQNIKNFGQNPFLISTPDEIKEFLSYVSVSKANILIDVAHLKVSSNSLNFSANKFLHNCEGRVGGYHLSDNDGLNDTNEVFNPNSWFWDYIDKKINYFTIEVYNVEPDILKKQRDIVEKKIK